MDYKKLYYSFVEYCKNTDINERIIKRNKNDFRLNESFIYTEKHHIIPKHSGGDDSKSNLVKLLPEEHLFIHKIRWKAFQERGDALAVRFILNGFNNKTQKFKQYEDIRYNIPKKLKQAYIWIKQYSSSIRKINGWQSKDGRKRISKSRKNKVVVMDKNGNCFAINKNDERYISGELKHHSSGRACYINTKTGEKEYIYVKDKKEYHKSTKNSKGENNVMWSGMTDDEIVYLHVEVSKKIGYVVSTPILCEYAKNMYDIKIPSSFSSCRFKNKSLVELTIEKTGLEYNPYVRGENRKILNSKLKEIYDKNRKIR